MKKLKLICPFHGYGDRIFGITLLVFIIAMFINNSKSTEDSTKPDILIFVAIGVIALMVLGIAVLLIAHESKEDRLFKEHAEPLEWIAVEDWEKEEIEALERPSYLSYGVLILLEIVMLAFGKGEMILLLVAMLSITIILFIINIVSYSMWKNMDSTAVKAVIPINRTYSVSRHVKHHGSVYKHFHEIYTPDGKIVLPHREIKSNPFAPSEYHKTSSISGIYTNIIVVKYKNLITYIEL